MYHVYHGTYTCTNITLSQKRLEIQALRGNGDTSGRCQHRKHDGILQLKFQLDSDVPWYVQNVSETYYHGKLVLQYLKNDLKYAIQALRCNGETMKLFNIATVGVVSIEDITAHVYVHVYVRTYVRYTCTYHGILRFQRESHA